MVEFTEESYTVVPGYNLDIYWRNSIGDVILNLLYEHFNATGDYYEILRQLAQIKESESEYRYTWPVPLDRATDGAALALEIEDTNGHNISDIFIAEKSHNTSFSTPTTPSSTLESPTSLPSSNSHVPTISISIGTSLGTIVLLALLFLLYKKYKTKPPTLPHTTQPEIVGTPSLPENTSQPGIWNSLFAKKQAGDIPEVMSSQETEKGKDLITTEECVGVELGGQPIGVIAEMESDCVGAEKRVVKG
ncbi:hypothetical protein GLAREA_04856 [Glarea lozoyensis ATCC 20868]|uniref:Uncharacterized protein n=1 Tax=Glarea lozoyensis (strain ATCC 20868 / MF5171) TaxID=1116229 RepID=S3CQV6_GLAL2|nr:uncharacterized protein GLAREA_04856 [Glarea lozoyensis ATCC 20868]EPE28065.1 hypothetical protein GLAREA_04856 [Glarea lozoyensis ATCC 20868]